MMFTVAEWAEVTWHTISFLGDFSLVGIPTGYVFGMVEQKILMILMIL